MRIKAFTLIETIIVVGITSMILPIIFSIVFVILNQQAKIIRLQEVKRQGDFVLSTIKTTIRNSAVQIYSESSFINEQCSSPINPIYGPDDGNDFYFKDKSGSRFNYFLSTDKISSTSAVGATVTTGDLTNNKIIVSAFSIKCTRQSIYSPAIITLSITLQYNTTSTRPEDTAQLTYRTNIKLKSY